MTSKDKSSREAIEDTAFTEFNFGEVAKIPRRTRYRPEFYVDSGIFGIRISSNGHAGFIYSKDTEYLLFIQDCRGNVIAAPVMPRKEARLVKFPLEKVADH